MGNGFFLLTVIVDREEKGVFVHIGTASNQNAISGDCNFPFIDGKTGNGIFVENRMLHRAKLNVSESTAARKIAVSDAYRA